MNLKTKICGRCNNDLPLNNDYFANFKRSNDGYSSICKPCKREYDREYREKNKAKLAIKKREYAQKNKVQENERSRKWYKENQDRVRGYRKENKERISEYNKKQWAENKEERKILTNKWREKNADYIKMYRKINRERDRIQQRKWYNTEHGRKISINKTNAYRAKKKELVNDFTVREWNSCLEYFNQSCAYCGESNESLEQEHFIPVSKNGPFTRNNIVPSCRECNASKLNSDFETWYKNQEHYTEEREMKILSYLGRKE